MRAVNSKRMEHWMAGIPQSGLGLPAVSEGDQQLRIVMVTQETFLLTYVWHLTAFFGRVCPKGLLAWKCWSYTDIAEPLEMTAASEAVRLADWVVFCQATPTALPTHVKHWTQSWPAEKPGRDALVGFFSIVGDDSSAEGKAQVYLRTFARNANRTFVAVRDYLWGRQTITDPTKNPT